MLFDFFFKNNSHKAYDLAVDLAIVMEMIRMDLVPSDPDDKLMLSLHINPKRVRSAYNKFYNRYNLSELRKYYNYACVLKHIEDCGYDWYNEDEVDTYLKGEENVTKKDIIEAANILDELF